MSRAREESPGAPRPETGGPGKSRMVPTDLIRKVRQIEIRTNRLVNDLLAGEYHSVFKGRGMEFSEVREYVIGDDIRSIDWNVTARMGHPYVKRYVEERELTVMLLVDASRSGEFGSAAQLKGEIAVEVCALLAFSAIQNNDRVGLIIFTDKVEKYVPPKKGRQHVLRLVRELLYFKPERAETNVGEALEYLQRVQKRKSVVFLISDFLSPDFETPLRIANRRHDIVALTLTDPRERALPPVGLIELEDAETGETVLVDTWDSRVRDLFAELSVQEASQMERIFKRLSVDNVEIRTHEPYVLPLVRFFRKRASRF